MIAEVPALIRWWWSNPYCQKLIWDFFQIWYDGHCLNYSSMFNNTHFLEASEIILTYHFTKCFWFHYSYSVYLIIHCSFSLFCLFCFYIYIFQFNLEITKPFSKWSYQSHASQREAYGPIGVSCLGTKQKYYQKIQVMPLHAPLLAFLIKWV